MDNAGASLRALVELTKAWISALLEGVQVF